MKKKLNVRLAGDHLYRKLLFTWLSLVMSSMVSFCAVPFPTRCLGWYLELNWVNFLGFSYLLLYYVKGNKGTLKFNLAKSSSEVLMVSHCDQSVSVVRRAR